jgi:hypothetical protein
VPVARFLLVVAAVAFAVTGLGYLFVPGAMLGVVGITGTPVTEFLIRTEGVALVTGAALWWVLRGASGRSMRLALLALAFYCVLGSIIDLAAFSQGIVGPLSIPSAVARIALGVWAGWVGRSLA